MAFQFLCPRGHLLQGEAMQSGQRCKCPYCQTEFLVPQPSCDPQSDHLPVARAETPAPPPVRDEPPSPPKLMPPQQLIPLVRAGRNVVGDPAEVLAQLGLLDSRHQSAVQIPCPNGHLLETPREMLGQDAMCPHCGVLFRLRLEDSLEYERERAERRQRREQALGKAWLHWAIAAAVVVVLGIIVLVAVAAYR